MTLVNVVSFVISADFLLSVVISIC